MCERCSKCGLPLVRDVELDLGMCDICLAREVERSVSREEWNAFHDDPWNGCLYDKM